MLGLQRFVCLFALVIATPVFPQANEFKVVAGDPQVSQFFGFSTDVDGDRMVVGAPEDDTMGLNSGAAYVFRKQGDTWVQEQKLFGSSQTITDEFGTSVAIARDLIVVGAPFDNDTAINGGAIYIFRRNGTTWTEEVKLTSSDPTVRWMGFSVDIGIAVPDDSPSGEEVIDVIAGAPESDTRQGAIVLFELSPDGTQWNELARLVDDEVTSRGELGVSVAISRDRIVGGAPDDDVGGTNAGGAYIFRRQGVKNAWFQDAALRASDADAGDLFGASVAIEDIWVIVGAPFDDDGGISTGSAYLYFGVSTNQTEFKIGASDAAIDDRFGSAVAVKDARALVGAPQADAAGNNSGAAYDFRVNDMAEWNEHRKIVASDAMANDLFGSSMALDPGSTLIGASFADVMGTNNAGAVYAFDSRLFADGFETGNTNRWSSTVP